MLKKKRIEKDVAMNDTSSKHRICQRPSEGAGGLIEFIDVDETG